MNRQSRPRPMLANKPPEVKEWHTFHDTNTIHPNRANSGPSANKNSKNVSEGRETKQIQTKRQADCQPAQTTAPKTITGAIATKAAKPDRQVLAPEAISKLIMQQPVANIHAPRQAQAAAAEEHQQLTTMQLTPKLLGAGRHPAVGDEEAEEALRQAGEELHKAEEETAQRPTRNAQSTFQDGERPTRTTQPETAPYPPYYNAYGQPWGYAPYPPWGPPMGPPPYSGDQSSSRNEEWSNQMLQEVGLQKNVKYPKNWKIPPPNQIPPEYRYYDVQRVISQGMIKPFMGTIEDYPRFQQSFYNMIHIQPGPIFQKVLAMDKLITDSDTVRMLAGLGTTAGDYLSRIERLEQTYGGPNRLKNHHLRVLRKLEGRVDDSLENFKTYTYAVDNYLKNSPESEADNLVLLHMLKGRMSRALRVEYNAYLQQERIEDDNRSVSLFLRNKLTTEIEAREEESAFPQTSQKAAKSKETKKAPKPSAQQIHQAGRLWTSTETLSSESSNEHATHQAIRTERPVAAAKKRVTKERSSTPCMACGSDQHYVTNCERFFLMTSVERRQLAADKGACYVCLNTSHRSKDCPKREYKRCGICKGKHHYLLHLPGAAQANQHQLGAEEPDPDSASIDDSDAQLLSCAYQEARRPKANEGPPPLDIAITYITVWIQNPKNGLKIKANLLADSGANSCSLDTKIGNELGLQGKAEPYYVQVGGGRINSYSAFAAPVIIKGTHPDAQEFNHHCPSLRETMWKLGSHQLGSAKAKVDSSTRARSPRSSESPRRGNHWDIGAASFGSTTGSDQRGPSRPSGNVHQVGMDSWRNGSLLKRG